MFKLKILVILVVLAVVGGLAYQHRSSTKSETVQSKVPSSSVKTTPTQTNSVAKKAAVNYCSDNTSGQNIIVKISAQHLWACDGSTSKYDSAVITGMEMYPADLTPTGTYHIYGKMTDQTLKGSDDTGSWSDFVYYWMPFLDNKYGAYGFHDLSDTVNGSNGRSDTDFGNIDITQPYTAAKHGSHGCVELPLATAKWLYSWASVGTTVTITS